MKKERVLIWGNGNTLKQNVFWIEQIYQIVGITGSDICVSEPRNNLYKAESALKLKYDFILIVSLFYEEIRKSLVQEYGADGEKIRIFSDEFDKERNMTFGKKNENIHFYILRAHWQERKNGFFNFVERAFTIFWNTQRKGMELLIDMKNYYTEYAGMERYGKVNVWEDYFAQPSAYTLDEAYESCNVTLSRFQDEAYMKLQISSFPYATLDYFIDTGRLLGKKFYGKFKLSGMLESRLELEKKKLDDKGKVLGVLARGTDMVYLKPENHYIPCETEKLITLCRLRMEQSGYDYLYLATEDTGIYEKFIAEFGEKCISTDQKRTAGIPGKVLMDIKFDRENDGYLRGLEYCLAIALLAECDALVANCYCGGAAGAVLLNGGKYRKTEMLSEDMYK